MLLHQAGMQMLQQAHIQAYLGTPEWHEAALRNAEIFA
jgi:hypothetical protein